MAFVDRDKRKAAQAIKLNFPYQGNSSKSKHSFVHFPALKLAAPAPPPTLASTQEQDSAMDIEEPVWYLDHEHLGAEVADDNPLVLSMCALNTPWSNLHLRVLAAMHLQKLSIPADIDSQFFSVLHPVSASMSSRPNIHPATPTPNYSKQALGTSTKTNLPPKTVVSGKRARAPNGTKILLEKLRQLQLDSPDFFDTPSLAKDSLLQETLAVDSKASTFTKAEISPFLRSLKTSLPWNHELLL